MRTAYILFGVAALYCASAAQEDSVTFTHPASLPECVRYAVVHQPLVQQAHTDEEIANRAIQIKLADWFPQLSLDANLTHNAKLTLPPGAPPEAINSSTVGVSLTQTIFNRDVLLAGVTARAVREDARQRSEITSIDVIVNVSKAYYAVLTTSNQLLILSDDIVRLKKGREDALSQYRSGIVDKTDYQRATILLNNAQSDSVQAHEQFSARLAFLKQLMGYPGSAPLQLVVDSTKWEEEMRMDTTQRAQYENRIEFLELQTERRLQEANVLYSKWSFLPALSAYGAYNLNYGANTFPPLYNVSYPNAYLGVRLSFPIFQGGRRLEEISLAKFQMERTDLDIERSKQSIDADFAQASANYIGSLRNYYALKENAELAEQVYNTLQLQYKSGIKTYLDVLTAENDLRSAEANRNNALFQVMSGKLDLEKALGLIHSEMP
jgi:outer membrane protein